MVTSANMSYVFRLILVIVVMALHLDEAQSQRNPGLQFVLSQRCFNFVAQQAVDKLFENPAAIKISDTDNFRNVHITGATKPSSNIAVSPGGIAWTLNNVAISLTGNWRYEKKVLFVKIRDSGSLKGSVSGASISVSVRLDGLDPTGHPTIVSTGCSCSISSMSVNLSGGASWLYELLIGLFKNKIRSKLEEKICDATTDFINGKARDLLKSFPLQMIVHKDWTFDYSFLAPPSLFYGSLSTKHKGTFRHKDNPIDPPITAEACPATTSSDKMVAVCVSEYVPNTMCYALYTQGLMSYILTPSNLPDELKNGLSTTCPPEDNCLGNIFPELSSKYPNSVVEVEMAVNKAPTTQISSSGIRIDVSGAIICRAKLPNDTITEVIKLNVYLSVSVHATLSTNLLRCNVTQFVSSVEVVSSSLNNIPNDMLSQVVDSFGNSLLIPSLNNKCQEGMPIPVLNGVAFTNVVLEMKDHCLYFGTDVQRV